jgi:hypothetical protein
MEIKRYNVTELDYEEMIQINGGGKLGDALRSAWNAICDTAEWVWDKFTDWCYDKYMDYTLLNIP